MPPETPHEVAVQCVAEMRDAWAELWELTMGEGAQIPAGFRARFHDIANRAQATLIAEEHREGG